MNLRISDPRDLVDFLHETISKSGEPVLTVDGYEVVKIDDRFFYYSQIVTSVGGPFPSLPTLIRSEGIVRHPKRGTAISSEEGFEVIEWCKTFFRIGSSHVSEHLTLGEAMSARGS